MIDMKYGPSPHLKNRAAFITPFRPPNERHVIHRTGGVDSAKQRQNQRQTVEDAEATEID
jgi:hypothetical protein